jgi:hypothetical protein
LDFVIGLFTLTFSSLPVAHSGSNTRHSNTTSTSSSKDNQERNGLSRGNSRSGPD